jgi:hypothetical protein
MITAEVFEAAVGCPPRQDDLARANCAEAGQLGHWFCGWDRAQNLPVFLARSLSRRCDTPNPH